MKKPDNPKEQGLVKAALRRVFSRSELRRKALQRSQVEHKDPAHPRVTKWSMCPDCRQHTPSYKMQVDHVLPVIRVNETLSDLTLDELAARIWCDENNLVALCIPCHKAKSKLEAAERRKFKKTKGTK